MRGKLFVLHLINFSEDKKRPAPTLPVPLVIMPVPQFSTPVEHRTLSILDPLNGAGPDSTQTQMVRWLADGLAEPLSNLCANFLTPVVVPTDLGMAITCPIH